MLEFESRFEVHAFLKAAQHLPQLHRCRHRARSRGSSQLIERDAGGRGQFAPKLPPPHRCDSNPAGPLWPNIHSGGGVSRELQSAATPTKVVTWMSRSSRHNRDRVDLYPHVARQPRRFYCRAGWRILRKILPVDFIHLRELAHILYIDCRLQYLVQARAAGFEDRFQIL